MAKGSHAKKDEFYSKDIAYNVMLAMLQGKDPKYMDKANIDSIIDTSIDIAIAFENKVQKE